MHFGWVQSTKETQQHSTCDAALGAEEHAVFCLGHALHQQRQWQRMHQHTVHLHECGW